MAHIRMSSESSGNIRKLPKLLRKKENAYFLNLEVIRNTHEKRNHQEYLSN